MENKTKFTDLLNGKTAEQLVDLFNAQVGVTHWVSMRGRYLNALRKAFQDKGIDYSCVTNSSGGFNLAKGNEVFLKQDVLHLVAGDKSS